VSDTLTLLGFTQVHDFQTAWNLGTALTVDGIVGPHTTAALEESAARHHAGEPDISTHYSAHQFACHCGGVLPGCHKTKVLRGLLESLEHLHTHGEPLTVVSGYRCPQRNASVGGATHSQHLFGAAADVQGVLSHAEVTGLGLFAGIGYMAGTGRVVHVDRRDISPENPTHSTLAHPALWTYAAVAG
jgi:hypothetical protein